MLLDDAIMELRALRKSEGNIQLTCTGSLLREDDNGRSTSTEIMIRETCSRQQQITLLFTPTQLSVSVFELVFRRPRH